MNWGDFSGRTTGICLRTFSIPASCGDGGGDAADAGLEIGEILSRLGAERKRCTYGAVAGVLGISTAEVGPLLGERRQESSWVVSSKTGRPTGYSPEQIHPELERHPDVISDPGELRALCRTGS